MQLKRFFIVTNPAPSVRVCDIAPNIYNTKIFWKRNLHYRLLRACGFLISSLAMFCFLAATRTPCRKSKFSEVNILFGDIKVCALIMGVPVLFFFLPPLLFCLCNKCSVWIFFSSLYSYYFVYMLSMFSQVSEISCSKRKVSVTNQVMVRVK